MSADLLSYSVAGTVVIPHYLGEHDHPWLRVLLEEHERFIGRPQRELEVQLREPLPCESPPRKLRLAIQVLGRLRPRNRKSAVPPRGAREHVFGEAARTSAPPHAVWSAVAASLSVSLENLQESLFADLPGERIVAAPAQPLSAVELALRCNLAIVQEMLFRAAIVRVEVEGNVFQGRRLTLQLGVGDPIFPSSAPRRYDSLLEECFAREFRRLAPAWDVIREPEPVVAADTLIFPDFALQHRSDPTRRWLLEIAGFWTPDYVTRKLALYRSARLPSLILCIDGERNCAEADLPSGARVIRYRRRVDPAAVLRAIETTPWPCSP